jgi:hypothetical protein
MRVKPAGTVWTLDTDAESVGGAGGGQHPVKVLTLTLDKAVETWWTCLVTGHPEIDATQVDSTRQVTDYDEETQAAIRKIMFDQQAKARGEMTSEELQMESIMARARHAPGSPFLPDAAASTGTPPFPGGSGPGVGASLPVP